MIKQDESIDYDKFSIKIIKMINNSNNKFVIDKDPLNNDVNYLNNIKHYSYNDSPISIKSRYYKTNNIINDKENDNQN